VAVPQGLDIPFRMFASGGCSPNSIVGDAVFDRSIRTILRTFPGERPYRPLFGSYLRSVVFANMSEGAAMQASDEVSRSLARWEPRISVKEILFTLKDNSIQLTIVWSPNGRNQDSTTTIEFEA